MQKTILFTGGGSAGHVTPNLALIEYFRSQGWSTLYIGSEQGIERELIKKNAIPYYPITTDKLRRYFTWQNFLAPFKVIQGVFQAFILCRKLKPQVIFSKGGFVALPVVVGAWLNRIPIVIHESDLTPGLANRLSFPFANFICVTFAESTKFFSKQQKTVVTGTPIRKELTLGNRSQGLTFCGFQANKPVLLVFGGGLGSGVINQAIRQLLPSLLEHFQIVHLCGKGKTDPSFTQVNGYKQYEYINAELPHIMACTDLVISRAGANSIYELLALRKPHILIPLSTKASRGDQIINAEYFKQQYLSPVIYEDELKNDKLLHAVLMLNQQKETIRQRLEKFVLPNSVEKIYEVISQITHD